MICPRCKSNNVYVINTRYIKCEDVTVRKRECRNCDEVFYTEEFIVSQDRGKELLNFFYRNFNFKK